MYGADDFQKRVRRLQRAKKTAHELLDVPANPSREVLKKAWRTACKKYHPDMQDSPEERRKCQRLFTLSQWAYRCLRKGEDCKKLLDAVGDDKKNESATGESPDTEWGYFLKWRDQYF